MRPLLYRKRPVVVEAMQLREADHDGWCEVIAWINENGGHAAAVGDRYEPHVIRIDTLEGGMYADPKDFVIRGVHGEFYPCKPDIFRATYDLEGGGGW